MRRVAEFMFSCCKRRFGVFVRATKFEQPSLRILLKKLFVNF